MDYKLLMDLAARLGTRIAMSGAETYRVEECVTRLFAAYGVEAQVYSVPKSLFISVIVPGEAPLTKLCRIENRGTDLDAVERYSNLGRRICTEKPDLDTAMKWVQEFHKARKQYSFPMVLLGYGLVAWGFSVFFGGGWIESICAILCGAVLGAVEHFMAKHQTNVFFKTIVASFILALVAYSISSTGIIPNVDSSIIGALMLLVPGLLFTNAMRDAIFGDTNSSVIRVVETLLIAVAIAIGTAAAWNVVDATLGIPTQTGAIVHSDLVMCVVSFIACLGFVIVFNIHGKGKWLCALGGAFTWFMYCVAEGLGGGNLLCCFVATSAAAVYSEAMARIRRFPAISYLVISLLPLIPGAGIYYTAREMLEGSMMKAAHLGLNTLATAGVMAAGILVVSTAVRMWTSYKAGLKR